MIQRKGGERPSKLFHDQSPQKYGTALGSNSRPLDLQSDTHLKPDTLPTALRGPVCMLRTGLTLFTLIPHRIFKRLGMALIRMRVCAGWSDTLLVAHTKLLGISSRLIFFCFLIKIWAMTWDELTISLEYLKILPGYHLEFLSFKGGCTGSSESALVKMPHCWKSQRIQNISVHRRHNCYIEWVRIFHKQYPWRTRIFSTILGLTINCDKTKIVWIGSRKYSSDTIKTKWNCQGGRNFLIIRHNI